MGYVVRDWLRTAPAETRDPLPDVVYLALRDVAVRLYRDLPWLDQAVAPYRDPSRFHGARSAHLQKMRDYSAQPVTCADCGRTCRVDTIRRHRQRKHRREVNLGDQLPDRAG